MCTPDDTAADEIVQLLGGLPLALFLGGRYLAQRRQHTDEFAAWLHEQGLAALHFGNRPHKSIPLLMQSSLAQVSHAPALRSVWLASWPLLPFRPTLFPSP